METDKKDDLSAEILDEAAKNDWRLYLNPAFLFIRYIQYLILLICIFVVVTDLDSESKIIPLGTNEPLPIHFSDVVDSIVDIWPLIIAGVIWPLWVHYKKSANGSLIIGFILSCITPIMAIILMSIYYRFTICGTTVACWNSLPSLF